MHLEDLVSDTFIKYLTILDRSSLKFKKTVDDFRTKHIELKPKLKIKKHSSLSSDILNLMTCFYIPLTESYQAHILTYLLHGSPLKKFQIHFDAHASSKKPGIFKLHQPGLIVYITDFVTETEWRDIWKNIEAFQASLKEASPNHTLDILKKRYIRKSWHTIDLHLEIYRLHLLGYSSKRIADSLSSIKIEGNFPIKTEITYDEEYIRKKRNEIVGLIDSL